MNIKVGDYVTYLVQGLTCEGTIVQIIRDYRVGDFYQSAIGDWFQLPDVIRGNHKPSPF